MANFYSLSLTFLLLQLISLPQTSAGFCHGTWSCRHFRRFRRGTGTEIGSVEDGISRGKPEKYNIPSSESLKALAPYPMESLANGGKVTLVGAGPGDPDLLTLSAFKLLKDPEAFFICDRLVSSEIIDLIQGEVRIARKFPGCAEMAQEEIYSWAHDALSHGKHVVRLKIGDPFVFGRGGEEVITFRRFGVEPKVIPVSFNFLWYCGDRGMRTDGVFFRQ